MKTRLNRKTVLGLLFTATLVFSACSGSFGPTVVKVVNPLPHADVSSRHISGDAVQLHFVVLKDINAYSYNTYTEEAYEAIVTGGQDLVISSLTPGDYLFGVVLTDQIDGGSTVGMAVKKVVIEPGFNEVSLLVGPGIAELQVNDLSIDNPLSPPDGVGFGFANDTLILDIDRDPVQDQVIFSASFGSGEEPVAAYNAQLLGGGAVSGSGTYGDPYLVPTDQDGVEFSITSADPGITDSFPFAIRIE